MARIFLEVPTWDRDLQQLLNGRAVPRRWTTAPFQPGPIPVIARMVWERDGETQIEGRALGWTRTIVLVEVRDRRLGFNAAWLAAGDVRRRAMPTPKPQLPAD